MYMGDRNRTYDDGSKIHCLAAWLHPLKKKAI